MTYDKIPAINWSSLKHIAVSPLHYKWRLEHPEPRKPAFVIGGAVHTLILEPEKFDERYAVFDGKRDPRHKEWQAWQATHPGIESLKPNELAQVRAMAKAVLEHRIAGPILRGGRREEAVTWTDAVTGLACKGRLDYIRPDDFADLKSARDPAPKKFERATVDYGYAAQLAFYYDGAIASRNITGRQLPYIIAPEKNEPYDVVVFRLKPETLEFGRTVYRALLQRLVECTEANYWPGMAPELQELGLPPYASTSQLFTAEAEEEAF